MPADLRIGILGAAWIYNALVNSLHAEWNTAALRAGRYVPAEKPFAANAAEAHDVWESWELAGGATMDLGC